MQDIKLLRHDLSAGLYLIAMPIGNNKDISIRSLEYLGSVDVLACEDTRNFKSFIKTWGLEVKKILSYHMHNEASSTKGLIDLIKSGQSVALVSDAGTINVSDPGYTLVKACIEQNIPVTSLPGASALTTALSLCPVGPPYTFHGFIQKKSSARKKILLSTCDGYSHIFFESAHRITEHLSDALDLFKERQVCLLKDLSKTFEETHYLSVQDLCRTFQHKEGKGEFVLIYLPWLDDKEDRNKLNQLISVAVKAEMKNKDILAWVNHFSSADRDTIYNLIEAAKINAKNN